MSHWQDPRASRQALTQRNQVLWRALQQVQQGNLEAAQAVLNAAPAPAPSLGEVFHLYQEELETQAQQLRDTHQRAEQALGWFARLFRGLPVAAVMLDAQGLVVDANERARVELGLAAMERAAPVPLRRLMVEAQGELRLAAALSTALASAVENDSVTVDSVAMRGPDGLQRWVELRITRLPPHPGAVTPGEDDLGVPADPSADSAAALCVIHDLTAQREAQQARESAALAERARDIAQASAAAKSTLMSRLSHELRTPLNAVIGFSHLLIHGQEATTEQQRRRLGLIQDAGRHLLALVEDVLLVNRLGTGGMALHPQPVALPALVADVLAMQQPQVEARALQVVAPDGSGAPPPLEALADPRRVREILVNLISNAIKYNRQGGELRVSCEREGGQCVVSVGDTGIGLTPLQQAHLFEPFNRLGAENGPVEGTGLGLNIARSLAEAMGGEIRVVSQPGVGSTFSLRLPAVPAARPAPDLDDAGCAAGDARAAHTPPLPQSRMPAP